MLTFQQRRDTILSQFAKQKPIWKHLIVILMQKSKRINLLFLH